MTFPGTSDLDFNVIRTRHLHDTDTRQIPISTGTIFFPRKLFSNFSQNTYRIRLGTPCVNSNDRDSPRKFVCSRYTTCRVSSLFLVDLSCMRLLERYDC